MIDWAVHSGAANPRAMPGNRLVRISPSQAQEPQNKGKTIERHGRHYLKVREKTPKRNEALVQMTLEAFVRHMNEVLNVMDGRDKESRIAALRDLWKASGFNKKAIEGALRTHDEATRARRVSDRRIGTYIRKNAPKGVREESLDGQQVA